ncbi:hypothetical protein YC2023_044088 [Brassica napus]|uniref:(rape) hypothetical protein n=1 Tax=Brassica napus TaxID=3708 RepID=A0A816IR71_BRANA|nr:unnamed protein product [Brassica napus]
MISQGESYFKLEHGLFKLGFGKDIISSSTYKPVWAIQLFRDRPWFASLVHRLQGNQNFYLLIFTPRLFKSSLKLPFPIHIITISLGRTRNHSSVIRTRGCHR